MKKVLIGGIGNVLLGDDGVGPVHSSSFWLSRYEFEDGVEVLDLGTPALDLIDQISGKALVILIDSVDTDASPGNGAALSQRRDHETPPVSAHGPSLTRARRHAAQRRALRSRAGESACW
jgi:hydrogenase maturation protease